MTGKDRTTWRLIDTGSLPGPDNMAIDEALLNCFEPGKSLPILRIYGWNPPAFSCGRFQKPEEIIDLDRCRADGIPVVRRITGGGVIYHAEELTYSLVCPLAELPDSRNVRGTFFHLTSFLLAFYRLLGLYPAHAAECHGGRTLGERTALCFAGTESCDILLGGKKIGGNAQRRLKEVVFQHGSIPLRQMVENGAAYLHAPPSGLLQATTALQDEGVLLPGSELVHLLAYAFASQMDAVMLKSELNETEKNAADDLRQVFS